MSYIHQNPVKAKIVPVAEGYPWSSYRAYLGLDPCPDWLCLGETLDEFGFVPESQRLGYRKFVEEKEEPNPWDKTIGQAALGSEQFLKSIQNVIKDASLRHRGGG